MAGQSSKGNPASHRMANPNHKAVRASSWRRGEERKAAHRRENEARHQKNLKSEGPTPWEIAKAERFKSRAPQRAAWAKRQAAGG